MNDTSARPLPCEPVPPGELRRPPHPLLGILFVYAVAAAILSGATGGAGDPAPRLAIAAVGLVFFLAAAVHWIEGVEFRHVAAKLGWARPGWRWWLVAGGAALPAWIAGWARLAATDGGLDGQVAVARLTVVVIAVMGDAVWQEGFCRGFVFRGLMARHGFLAAAAVSAALPALLAGLGGSAGHPLYAGRAWFAALVEVPLSFAMCLLFWQSGQKLPLVLLVRASLLAAAWLGAPAWLAALAAAILFALSRAAAGARL